jgi:hypothetical protein
LTRVESSPKIPVATHNGTQSTSQSHWPSSAQQRTVREMLMAFVRGARVTTMAIVAYARFNEMEYGGLLRDDGDYFKMLNDLMDDLADIADAIPATS